MEREKSHWNENTPHVPSQVRRGNNTGQRMQVTGIERDERGCSSMWLWGFKLIEISDNYSKLIRHELGWSNKIIQFYSCDFLVLRQRFLSVFIREELGIKSNNFHFIFLFLTWLAVDAKLSTLTRTKITVQPEVFVKTRKSLVLIIRKHLTDST